MAVVIIGLQGMAAAAAAAAAGDGAAAHADAGTAGHVANNWCTESMGFRTL
jgi:hypothetical protein